MLLTSSVSHLFLKMISKRARPANEMSHPDHPLFFSSGSYWILPTAVMCLERITFQPCSRLFSQNNKWKYHKLCVRPTDTIRIFRQRTHWSQQRLRATDNFIPPFPRDLWSPAHCCLFWDQRIAPLWLVKEISSERDGSLSSWKIPTIPWTLKNCTRFPSQKQ